MKRPFTDLITMLVAESKVHKVMLTNNLFPGMSKDYMKGFIKGIEYCIVLIRKVNRLGE